jgi:hypothetical protein
VSIGGQRHVRYTAYAGLAGRTFSLTKRFVAEPGHLWGREGAPVRVLAFEQGLVIAEVTTQFASPKKVIVRGRCPDIAYVPTEPEHEVAETPSPIASAAVVGAHFDLHAAPSGAPFLRVELGDAAVELDVVGRSGTFSHVRATLGDLDVDAWVPAAQLDEDALVGAGIGLRGFGTGGGRGSSRTVAMDTPLLVGATPKPLDGAVVEEGAEIYESGSEHAVGTRIYVAFTFVDGLIAAPQGSNLWVARDAIR